MVAKSIPPVGWDTYPGLGKDRYPHLQIHKRLMSNWCQNYLKISSKTEVRKPQKESISPINPH